MDLLPIAFRLVVNFYDIQTDQMEEILDPPQEGLQTNQSVHPVVTQGNTVAKNMIWIHQKNDRYFGIHIPSLAK